MKLLLIEDHANLAQNIFEYFEPKGYLLDWARNGLHGMELAKNQPYDLIILDVVMPKLDGFSVCNKIRNELALDTPIIFLTAKSQLVDKVTGLDLGGDDYLVKPFQLRELESRVKSVIRRYQKTESQSSLVIEDLTIDKDTRQVLRGNQALTLPPIAYKILCLLAANRHRITTFREIEDHIWGEDVPESSSLRTHVHTLRTAVDKPFKTALIHTVPRVGLKIGRDDKI
ncbi:response regulator transcription factor [Aliikangiella coralliicola]|uniref:Response regulator transcription factor n=1 Tax=Aliikangiella coralliicola TaxID=2592383 RepID=A0A545UJC4_9GAMM|nr:response regulator transcription factor [Aliikangiella coralliicola]TQV89561.1 response regulator transcription factor [Aliikangiella coralliicola]